MTNSTQLMRRVGLPGAVMMGMGSILGTGVFVTLGLAAGITGSSMIAGLFFAALLAVCNGLSTAQLAAARPVSGGTYEYAYQYLNPWLGFLAGWLFVIAKTASAATAAIGVGGYLLNLWPESPLAPWQVALGATLFMTLISTLGIQRTSSANTVIVSITLLTLMAFVIGVSVFGSTPSSDLFSTPESPFRIAGFLEATALLFVAYTGYGRVATLGEEIKNPARNIPKAVIATLALSFILYVTVAGVALSRVDGSGFYELTVESSAPLERIAALSGLPIIANLLAIGAITALLGVLLNLILGVSRVVFAMGRKRDLPDIFTRISVRSHVPTWSVLATGVLILVLVFFEDIKTTWSFSAFTVLFYYSLTNAAALRLPSEQRLYPRVFAWAGLFGCLGLAFWVNATALWTCLGLLAIGILWRLIYRRINSISISDRT